MKEDDLIHSRPCAVCGKPIANELTFYLITIRRMAITRHAGPTMFDGPCDAVVHEQCAGRVGHLLHLMPLGTDDD